MTRPSSTGRIITMYCLPRAAQRPSAQRFDSRSALREQRVGLGAALVGREVVGLVEVHRVDRFERHELGDLGHVRAGLLHRLQLLGREHHVLVLREFVALDHVLARDRHFFLDADVLLLQPRAAGLVQQVEGDRLARLGGRIELHRDRHQPERDGQTRDRSCSHACLPQCVVRCDCEICQCIPQFAASARAFERRFEALLALAARRASGRRSAARRCGAFVMREVERMRARRALPT